MGGHKYGWKEVDSSAGKLDLECGLVGEGDELHVYLLLDYVGAYAPACRYDDFLCSK